MLDYLENMLTTHNMQSVTSNAVAVALLNYIQNNKIIYTTYDRNNESQRITAMEELITSKITSGIGTIGYSGGYYFMYIWNRTNSNSEQAIIEINPYTGVICVFIRNSQGVISKSRQI